MGLDDCYRCHDKSFLFLSPLSVSLFHPLTNPSFFSSSFNRTDPRISTQLGYLKFTPRVRDARCSRSQFPFCVPRIIERTITQQMLKYTQQTSQARRAGAKKKTKRKECGIVAYYRRDLTPTFFTRYHSLNRKKAVCTRHQGILMTSHNNFARSKKKFQ